MHMELTEGELLVTALGGDPAYGWESFDPADALRDDSSPEIALQRWAGSTTKALFGEGR